MQGLRNSGDLFQSYLVSVKAANVIKHSAQNRYLQSIFQHCSEEHAPSLGTLRQGTLTKVFPKDIRKTSKLYTGRFEKAIIVS